MTDEKKYPKPLTIYRRNMAFEFSIGKKGKMFISAAVASGQDQNGNILFDWKNKGTMALDEFELGAIIFYIENYFNPHCFDVAKKAASISSKREGIYHENKSGGASQLWFKGGEDRVNAPCFHLNFSIDKGTKSNYSITFSVAEATTIKILLQNAITIFHEWELLNKGGDDGQNQNISSQPGYQGYQE